MTRKVTTELVQAVFNLPWLVSNEEGLFAEEDLEVEFVRGRDRDPGLAPESDPARVDPFWRHAPFEEQGAQFFNACEWGQILRSDASAIGGRIVFMRPAVASQGIFVRPDSPIVHPQGLRNKTVAVSFHAGSHYLALQMLEGFMSRDEIKVVHLGQAPLRYQAMMDGEVDAAALMEPYIALAEKASCNLIMEAHYAGAEMAAPNLDPDTFEAINRAVSKAVRLINADKRKYVHHIIADLPPDLGRLTPDDFRLSRLRYIQPRPYPADEFEKTQAWMASWGLIPPERSFAELVDNRIAVSS
jgi:NitT/TauT family transport system substrate-binding protein